MSWESINKLYIATWNFIPKSTTFGKEIKNNLLKFYVGTLLVGIKESKEWIYGYKPTDIYSNDFYGYFPKNHVQEKENSTNNDSDTIYKEQKYSFEGKLIVTQSFRYLMENINVSFQNEFDMSEETMIEVLKIRENLIGKKYAENDTQNQLDIYYSKLAILFKLYPVAISCRENTQDFISYADADLSYLKEIYDKLIPDPAMVIRKKNNKSQTIQQNLSGRIVENQTQHKKTNSRSSISHKQLDKKNPQNTYRDSVISRFKQTNRDTLDSTMHESNSVMLLDGSNFTGQTLTYKAIHFYLEIMDIRFDLPESKIYISIFDQSTMNYTHEVFCFSDLNLLKFSKRNILFDSINRLKNFDNCYLIAYVVVGKSYSGKNKDSNDSKATTNTTYDYVTYVGALPLKLFIEMLQRQSKPMSNYQIPLRKVDNLSLDESLKRIESEMKIQHVESKSNDYMNNNPNSDKPSVFTFSGPYIEGLIIECRLYYQHNTEPEIDQNIIQSIGANNVREQTAYDEIDLRTKLISQYLDFPLMMSVSYVRNDLYITIKDLVFSKRKINDYNILLRASVIEPQNRTPIEAIYYGTNESPKKEYQSTFLLHERKPHFYQCIKVKYDPNIVINCHLRIDIFHLSTSLASESFIGFAYLPFNRASQRTVIESGEKNLLIYRTKDTSFVREMRYHGLPSTHEDLKYNTDSVFVFQTLKLKDEEVLNLDFNWYNTCFTSNNYLVSLLSANPGLNPNLKSVRLSSVIQPLEEYMRSSIAEYEIKKFLLSVVETLINILGAARKLRTDPGSNGKINDKVSILSFECLINTHDMVYREKKIDLFDLTITEELDGVTRLDDALRARENIFSNNCYLEIMHNICAYIANIENKSNEKTKFFNALPYLARICKVSRFKFNDGNPPNKQLNEELKRSILDIINLRYKFKNLFESYSDENFHKFALACILFVEIISDEEMDTRIHVEEIKNILKNSSINPKSSLTKRLGDIIIMSSIFEVPKSKMILAKEIINRTISNKDSIDFRTISSLVSVINQDYTQGSYDDLIQFFGETVIPKTIDYILHINIESLTDAIIDEVIDAGHVLLIYFSILNTENFIQIIDSLIKKSKKKRFIYQLLKFIEIYFNIVSNCKYICQKIDLIIQHIQQSVNLLMMVHKIITLNFMQPLEIGICCHFCDTIVHVLKCQYLRRTNINPYIYLLVRNRLHDILKSFVECLNVFFIDIRKLFSTKPEMKYLFPFLIRFAFVVGVDNMENIIFHILAMINDSIDDENSMKYFKTVTLENINLSIVDFQLSSQDSCNFYEMLYNLNITSGMNINLLELLNEVRNLTNILNENQSIDKHNSAALVLSHLMLFHNFSKSNQYDKMITSLKQIYNILIKNESQNFIELAFTIKEYFNTLVKLGIHNFEPGMKCKFIETETSPAHIFLAICNAALFYMKKCELKFEAINICKLTLPYLEEENDYKKLSKLHKDIADQYNKISLSKESSSITNNYTFFYIFFYGRSFKFLSWKNCIFCAEKGSTAENLSNLFRIMFKGAKFEFDIKKLGIWKKNSSPGQNNTIFIYRINPCSKNDKHFELNSTTFANYGIDENVYDRYSFKISFKWYSNETKSVNNLWQEHQLLMTTYPLPGISHLVLANLARKLIIGPVELAIEAIIMGTAEITRGIQESERTDVCDLLESRLQGTMAAGVNGGIENFKTFFTPEFISIRENESQKKYLPILQDTLLVQFKELTIGINTLFKKTNDTSSHDILMNAYKNYMNTLHNDFKISYRKLDDIVDSHKK